MLDSLHPREFNSRGFRSCAAAALLCLLSTAALAQETTFVRDVRLAVDAEPSSLVLEDGRIVGVLKVDAPVPPGSRIVEGEGRLCLPAFVDVYATAGVETPEPNVDQDRPENVSSDVRVEMREANRKGIQPTFRAASGLALEEPAKAWRKLGFAQAVVSPSGQLLAGDGCLVTTLDAAARDVVVDAGPWGHAAFRASGSGYPSTLMGYTTQLRQFFLDAQRHALLLERQRSGRDGERPRYDPELAAAAEYLGGAKRLVCEADSSRDIERWFRIADEFGLQIVIAGGRDAWRVADELARREVPVLLTLEWGKEAKDPDADDEEDEPGDEEEEAEEPAPDVEEEEPADEGSKGKGKSKRKKKKSGQLDEEWVYVEPLEVRRERRRLWEERRDCALRLREAGVVFAFGSGGEEPADLMKNVRALVEAGLPREDALAALTTTPTELLGRAARSGLATRGHDAHLALWTDDPLTEEDAKAAWIFIEGNALDLDLSEEEDEEEDDENDDEDRG